MSESDQYLTVFINNLDLNAQKVRDHLRVNGIKAPIEITKAAIKEWLYLRFEKESENLVEHLTNRQFGFVEAFEQDLRKRIKKAAVKNPSKQKLFDDLPSKFNGSKKFNQKKIEDLAVYLAYKKKANVYPTILNKLLFYSDFSFYYGMTKSITGAEYLKLERGPAYTNYKELLKKLSDKGRIRLKTIKAYGRPAEIIIVTGKEKPTVKLTQSEARLADWVIDTYGKLDTQEIIKTSHRERAWYEPQHNQTLDYNHASDLNIKPPPELFKRSKSL